ncbi:MAG TPA: hypothetical protein VEH76_11720 [Methylocystis sp.]|nr:hypothetical protein [Methylocystis sp.]
MLRFLIRLLGLLLLAGGFISLIVDGTASLAAGSLYVTTLAAALQAQAPAFVDRLRDATLAHLPPAIWDMLSAVLRVAPVSLALCALGALLILMSHKGRRSRGFDFEERASL